jgi:hypothetical protein
MYVWERYKFAFLAMPATGSVSTAKSICEMGGRIIRGHHSAPCWEMKELLEIGYDETWTTATTVREPISWWNSWWKKGAFSPNHNDPVSLKWVKLCETDREWFNPHERTLFWRYVPLANVIWHQETLQADIDLTCEIMGIPRIELKRRNCNNRPNPTWDDDAYEYVMRKYKTNPVFSNL